MAKHKVLIFGFSVTEQHDGYARVLAQALLDQVDVEVVVRGLGGMHPPEATYVFDSAIPRGSFDVVVLEVMTSGYRQEGVSLEDFGLALLQLTAKALRRGAHVIILNLPRRDVDYQSDESTRVAANISDDVGADFLDLASEMTTEQIDRDLLDGIHTTAVSAAAFASRVATVVLDRLGETPRRLSLEVLQVADSAQSALAYNLVPYAETLNLERSFNPSGVAIPGGTVLDVILYGETRVAGVTYFMGPRTGMLTIRSEGHNNLLINAYDAFCYYNRLNGILFKEERLCSSLSVYQSLDLPLTVLQKGEKDTSPRLGALVHVLVNTVARSKMTAQWSHLWSPRLGHECVS